MTMVAARIKMSNQLNIFAEIRLLRNLPRKRDLIFLILVVLAKVEELLKGM